MDSEKTLPPSRHGFMVTFGPVCWARKTRKFRRFRKAASLFCKWQCRRSTEVDRKQSLHYFDYSLERIILPKGKTLFRAFFYFRFWITSRIHTAESSSFCLLLSSSRCSPHGSRIPAWTLCANFLSFAMALASWREIKVSSQNWLARSARSMRC